MKIPEAILTPAPGAIFLRIGRVWAELSPGEAIRLREELDAVIRIALGAVDGRALLNRLPNRPRHETD